VLAIDEKALGPDHPKVARDLNTLALFYESRDKYAEAEPLLKRALAIDEKALGPDHTTEAKIAENLALTLSKLGRDAEAEVYEDQAAKIRAKKNQ
jgi:tetratricopeptide (TPR) repeat protein